jgi:hypothetical protein
MMDVPVRRKAFKLLFNCLLDRGMEYPSALVWLKANTEFDVCQKIIADWNNKGEFANFMFVFIGG